MNLVLTSTGFILVRIVNRGKPTEMVIPQRLNSTFKRCTDATEAGDVAIFRSTEAATITLQRCKLGRPESGLEVREAQLDLRILS